MQRTLPMSPSTPVRSRTHSARPHCSSHELTAGRNAELAAPSALHTGGAHAPARTLSPDVRDEGVRTRICHALVPILPAHDVRWRAVFAAYLEDLALTAGLTHCVALHHQVIADLGLHRDTPSDSHGSVRPT